MKKTDKVNYSKIIAEVSFLLPIIMLIIAFIINGSGEKIKTTYEYIENKIIEHSVSDIFETVIELSFIIEILLMAVSIILQLKRRLYKHPFLNVFSTGFFCFILFISYIIACGFRTKDDYSPEYYKFTDGKHTIVVEEKSFLLYGGADVYQILENGNAIPIGSFSTDDGGRNKGDYDLTWNEKSIKIKYHTFVSNNSANEITLEFCD